jgi:O-antigen/teichoic acid export membrane protein
VTGVSTEASAEVVASPAAADPAAVALRRSGFVFGGWAISTLGSFLVSISIVRLLQPADVGVYYLAMSVATFASIVARFGMDSVAIRVIAQALGAGDTARARSALGRTLAFAAAGGVAAAVFLIAFFWHWLALHAFGSTAMAGLRGAAGALVALLALEGTALGWLQGFGAMRLVGAFNAAMPILWGSALLVLWSTGSLTPAGVLLARGVPSALLTLGALAALRGRVRKLDRGSSVPARELADMGWAMMGTRLIATVTGNQSDLWILGAYAAATVVAHYGVALSMSLLVAAPFAATTVALGPMIADMHSRSGRSATERLLRTATGVVSIPTLLCAAVLIAFGRPLLGIVYGSHFRAAATILVVLCLAQCVFVLTGPCGLTLMMTGHHRAVFFMAATAAVCSFGADLWAAPRYGAVGVAIATSTVLAIDNVATTLLARRLSGVWTFAQFRPRDFRLLVKSLWIGDTGARSS